MPDIVTAKQLQALEANHKKAWEEQPPAFKACGTCPSPGYCQANGCQAKEAQAMKRLEG